MATALRPDFLLTLLRCLLHVSPPSRPLHRANEMQQSVEVCDVQVDAKRFLTQVSKCQSASVRRHP